jgi:acetyl esterase
MSLVELHPDAQAFLEELSRLDLPPSHGIPVTVLRERFEKICAHFAGRRRELGHVEDVNGPVRLRVYTPENALAGRSLLWFHGGRMISGNLKTHDAACRLLASTTLWPVVSVDYRLGPEHPFPAALEDASAALAWAAARFESVAVGGDSAGAALALRAALDARTVSCALVLVYPMVDATMSLPSHAEFMEGPGTSSRDISMGYDLWLPADTPPANPRVSPLFERDFSGLPPVWLGVAELDPLRDEGLALSERLRRGGVPVETRMADGHIHGFLTYPGRFREAEATAESIAGFLRICG